MQVLPEIDRDRYHLGTKLGRYAHLDIIPCHDLEFVEMSQIAEETIPAIRQGICHSLTIRGFPAFWKALRWPRPSMRWLPISTSYTSPPPTKPISQATRSRGSKETDRDEQRAGGRKQLIKMVANPTPPVIR